MHLIQIERDVANKAVLEGYKALDSEVTRRHTLEDANNVLQNEMTIATEQLIQADKLASLGQLVAGVAHDIASPTGLIRLSGHQVREATKKSQQLVQDIIGEPTDGQAKKVLEKFSEYFDEATANLDHIELGTDRIAAINNAIRNQARNDGFELAQSLLPIAEECCTILGSRLLGIEVELDVPMTATLDCKRSQVGQVLSNLLGNAADAVTEEHAGTKGGKIRLRSKVLEQQLVFEVEDNGPGIPPSQKEKVLEAFYTTKEVGKGTGLGMSISKKIIQTHGGTLEILDSVELGGACVRVVLPRVQGEVSI